VAESDVKGRVGYIGDERGEGEKKVMKDLGGGGRV